MTLSQAVILGIVQGLTEFLPVSSSGHLVIASEILKIKPDVAFDVLLHLGTLLAVTVFFLPDIIRILRAIFIERRPDDPYFRLGMLVIAASVPTAIMGFLFKDSFEALFNSVFAVGCFLILTGIVINVAERYGKPRKDIKKVSLLDSILIGIAQGCAIAPGLSRSGTTVSASLLLGLDRGLAARFSFLLSIPAILGATVFKAKEIVGLPGREVLFGFLFAAVTGYFAIWAFMGIIERRKITAFAYYCFFAGFIAIMIGK